MRKLILLAVASAALLTLGIAHFGGTWPPPGCPPVCSK